MLNFFTKKDDTVKEQQSLHNVDILILELLKKKENQDRNKKEDKNKIKKIYRELNSFILK